MNTVRYKILMIMLLTGVLAWANNPIKGKYKKLKVINKVFSVNSDANLHLDNTYGNITITSWQKNEIEITVKITASSDDPELAEKKLNDITISISGDEQNVYAKTNAGDNNYSSGGSLFSYFFGKHVATINFQINYEVKMPVTNNLYINNDYGDIYIDELQGNLDLDADYGKFVIGDLTGEHNTINIDYFSHSEIDFIKTGRINADYSTLNITNAYNLKVESDYTKLHIDKIRNLRFSNDYGSISVDNSMVINGDGDYQTRYFGNVNNIYFYGDYGSIKIENIRPNFDRINLKCDYTNIRIDNTQQASYKFTMDQEYGCFKYDNLKVYKQIEDSGDKHIEATYGNENTNSSIKINSDYGCVKIYNN